MIISFFSHDIVAFLLTLLFINWIPIFAQVPLRFALDPGLSYATLK